MGDDDRPQMDQTLTGGGQPWARLVMQQGPQPGQTYQLNKSSLLIGRAPECDVVVDDPRVSRRHARLRWKGRQLFIEDLNSANGTLLNGVRITSPGIVRDGDIVAVGPALFGFQDVAAFPARGTEAPARPGPPRAKITSLKEEGPAEPTLTIPRRSKEGGPWLALGSVILLVLAVVAALLVIAIVPQWLSQPPAGIPSVEIKAPHVDTRVQVGDEVVVEAVATDAKGVTRVELWVDGVLVSTMATSAPQGQSPFPVTLRWTPGKPGSYTLEVRAYNAAGRQSVPTSVAVKVVPVIERPTPPP
jgi:hypothetical protein